MLLASVCCWKGFPLRDKPAANAVVKRPLFVFSGPSFEGDQVTASCANPPVRLDRNYRCNVSDQI